MVVVQVSSCRFWKRVGLDLAAVKFDPFTTKGPLLLLVFLFFPSFSTTSKFRDSWCFSLKQPDLLRVICFDLLDHLRQPPSIYFLLGLEPCGSLSLISTPCCQVVARFDRPFSFSVLPLSLALTGPRGPFADLLNSQSQPILYASDEVAYRILRYRQSGSSKHDRFLIP